jgi:hypothetical protein
MLMSQLPQPCHFYILCPLEGWCKLYLTPSRRRTCDVGVELNKWPLPCTGQAVMEEERPKSMRILTVLVLSLGIAAAGCDRGHAAAAASTLADAPPALGTSTSAATTVATNGRPMRGPELPLREVTIPAGTRLPITLDTTVGSDISRLEQPVSAHLTRPLLVGGATVLPAGSHVGGIVTSAVQSGKVQGRAHVALRFDSVTPAGPGPNAARYSIDAAPIGRTAPATKGKDALKIGGSAAGGAIIGALAGGKKGALIGTAVGGGAGTAVVLSTRGKEVRLPKGSALTLQLAEPLTVKMRG